MVNKLPQTSFSAEKFDSSRLNLHTKPDGFSSRLVIFVHGLGGKGYETWNQFPAAIFNGHSIDVALFDYVSFTRRVRIPRPGSPVQTYVDMLTESIRELENNYESIYLIAHSLGGIIAENAVMQYLINKRVDKSTALTPICGMILFASPRAGAALALPILRKLSPEGEWLRRGSQPNRRSDAYFSDHIESDLNGNVGDPSASETKISIPRFVCLGARDRMVDPFSAAHSIPTCQRHVIAGNHRSIVKPIKPSAPEVKWVNEKIAEIEARRQQIRERQYVGQRKPQAALPRAAIVVTEFWATGGDAPKWERVYNDVRDSARFSDPEVYDNRDVSGAEVNLLISLTNSDLVMNDSANQKAAVGRVIARKEANSALTVGLSAVGEKTVDATKIMENWLNERIRLPHISVNEAADIDTLRSVIYMWISNVVSRHPRSSKSRMYQIDRQIQTDISSIDPVIGN